MYDRDAVTDGFSERLRKLCDKQGMTICAVARKAGVSSTTVYCHGNRHWMPSLYTAMGLANALGVDLDTLLGVKHEG